MSLLHIYPSLALETSSFSLASEDVEPSPTSFSNLLYFNYLNATTDECANDDIDFDLTSFDNYTKSSFSSSDSSSDSSCSSLSSIDSPPRSEPFESDSLESFLVQFDKPTPSFEDQHTACHAFDSSTATTPKSSTCKLDDRHPLQRQASANFLVDSQIRARQPQFQPRHPVPHPQQQPSLQQHREIAVEKIQAHDSVASFVDQPSHHLQQRLCQQQPQGSVGTYGMMSSPAYRQQVSASEVNSTPFSAFPVASLQQNQPQNYYSQSQQQLQQQQRYYDQQAVMASYHHLQMLQQQEQQQHYQQEQQIAARRYAAIPSAQSVAPVPVAPAFQTPQGTFYFVPTAINNELSVRSDASSEYDISPRLEPQVQPQPQQHVSPAIAAPQPVEASLPLVAPVARRASVISSVASGLAAAASIYEPALQGQGQSRQSTASPNAPAIASDSEIKPHISRLLTKKASRTKAASAGKASVATKKPVKARSPPGGQGAHKDSVKRFVCPYDGCGRAFARNFNMQSHLKSHLGIREFDCPGCTKKFSRRHDRARHCAAVHDIHNVDDPSVYPEFAQGSRRRRNSKNSRQSSQDVDDAADEDEEEDAEQDDDNDRSYTG